MFINTSIIRTINSFYFFKPMDSPQGIVASVSGVVLQLSVMQLAQKIICCPIFPWMAQMCCKKNGATLYAQTFQDNLNSQMELPPYEIGETYLAYLNSLYMAAFFAYIAPWASLIVAVNSTFIYFA